MTERTYPWFPSNEDYEKRYVRDKHGTIWLVVRDGGMVTTADYSGQVYSAGLAWLENNHGPLQEVPVSVEETKQEHLYLSYGRWIRGYGASMDPHYCGDENEPCVTNTYKRKVSEWELTDKKVVVNSGEEG